MEAKMEKQELLNVYSYHDSNRIDKGITIILDALSDIRREPKLFKFVIRTLKKQMACQFNDFFVINYGENYEKTYNWVFTNFKDAQQCITNLFNSDTHEPIPKDILFEKYKISQI
jgi:hypothetical protein